MRHTAILAAAIAAAIGVAPAAAAANGSSSATVRYADLDLSTKAGQEQLDRRIDNAARAACGMNEVRTGTRMPSTSAKRCFEETRASVHEQVAELIAREDSRG